MQLVQELEESNRLLTTQLADATRHSSRCTELNRHIQQLQSRQHQYQTALQRSRKHTQRLRDGLVQYHEELRKLRSHVSRSKRVYRKTVLTQSQIGTASYAHAATKPVKIVEFIGQNGRANGLFCNQGGNAAFAYR